MSLPEAIDFRAYDALDLPIVVIGADGAVRFANAACAALSGGPDVVSPADLPPTGEPFAVERALDTPGGPRWFRVVGKPLADRAAWVCHLLDVHDRRLVEERAARLGRLGAQILRARGPDECADLLRDEGAAAAGAREGRLWLHEEGALRPLGAGPSGDDGEERALAQDAFEADRPVFRSARAALPLRGEDGPLGALVLVWEAPPPLDPPEREFLAGLAWQFGLALDRALAHERQARDAARLDVMLDAVPAAIAFYGPDLRYERVNAETARLNRIEAAAHPGRTLEEVVPDIALPLRKMLEQVLETGQTVRGVPITSMWTDDEERDFLASFAPVRDTSGTLLGAGVFALDVTEEMRAADALREAERRFRLLAENSEDLISRHAPDGAYLYVSPSFEKVLGYTEADLLGRAAYDFIEPEDLESLRAEHLALLAGGETRPLTFRMRHKDGRVVWIESTVHAARDEDGELLELQLASRDVTARVRAERALAEERARLMAVVQHLDEGVIAIEPSGQAVLINAAALRLHGYASEDDLPGRHMLDFANEFIFATLDGRPLPLVEWPISRALRGERLHDVELEFRRTDGSVRHVMSYNTALVNREDGSPLMALIAMRDVTERREAEFALRDSETRFRALVQHAALGVARLAPDGRWLDVNPAVARLLGYGRAELLGTRFQDVLCDDTTLDDAFPELARLRHGQLESFAQEQRLRCKDGSVVWANLTFTSQRDDWGVHTALIVMLEDVTERRRVERELAERREQLDLAFETGRLGVWAWDLTRDRVLTAGKLDELFGLPAGLQEYRSEQFFARVHPDDVERVREEVQRVISDGEELHGEFRTVPDGDRERWLVVDARVHRDARGHAVRLVGVNTDITDRKTAEQGRAQLAQLVEESGDFIALSSLDDRVFYINDAGRRLLGLDRLPDHGPLRVEDVFWPEDIPFARSVIRPSVLEQGRWSGDLRFRHFLTQEAIPVNVNGFVVRDPLTNRPIALASVARDIRARRKAEDAIRALNADLEKRVEERTERLGELHAELTAFATSVSRDIQEPLRRIAGFSSLLERRLSGVLDERALGFLRFIREDGSRVAELAEDLSQFAIFGREEPQVASVPLDQLVVQVRSDLATFTRGRHVEWSIGALPRVRADALLLRQALAALLHNALKFTRGVPEARIEIGAEERPGEVVAWVRDNGAGFDPARADDLFRVFTRLHGDTFEGAGVGLANVRRIVTRHGGRVWAEGTEGKGATFYFSLPNGG